MKIKNMNVRDVKPYGRNPRINQHAVDTVARSITEYGFRQPIVVDADGVIIVGHTRLMAAQKLGMDEVPVHVADMSSENARAYRLADNRTAELAYWDRQALIDELAEMDSSELIDDLFPELDVTKNHAEQDAVIDGMEFSILISCRDEEHQRELIGKLSEMGLDFRCIMI